MPEHGRRRLRNESAVSKKAKHISARAPAQKRSAGKARDLLLVLGMHRSGTSALAGTLQHLGVELGRELVAPTEDNPRGYFENLTTVLAQEHLFEAMGYRWHDPRPLPDGWRDGDPANAARETLAGVVEELFANTTLAAIKDPRSCRLVPLWRDVAEQEGVRISGVIMLRHPSEVAASLHRRDEMSSTRAYLLWIRYLLEAERETRTLDRVFVEYGALLKDWRGQIRRIMTGLGIEMPEFTDSNAKDVDGFLDSSLRNHVRKTPKTGVSNRFEALAISLYELARSCVNGQVTDADKQFDELAARFDLLAEPYIEAVQDSLALEVPVKIEETLQLEGIDKARVDTALQLAALRELWRPATLARPPGPCRLYYRSESQPFAEERTVVAHPKWSKKVQVAVFELPFGAEVAHLRIDPDDVPGVYAVHALSVCDTAIDNLADRVTAVSELILPASSSAPLRFAALGEDPHFEMSADGLSRFVEADGAMRIHLRFRVETVSSQIAEQVQDFGIEAQRNHHKISEQQRYLQNGLDELADKAASLAESLALAQRLADEARDAQRQDSERSFGLIEASGAKLDALTTELSSLQKDQAADKELRDARYQRLGQALESLELNQSQLTGVVADLSTGQTTLLTWARRRSPVYWWRRLVFGTETPKRTEMTRLQRLDMVPLANVEAEDRGEHGSVWLSRNEDPQFLLGGPRVSLSAGWYFFEAHFKEVEGLLMSPCLYPNYGPGATELGRIPLPEPGNDGKVRAVILLKHQTVSLRFDPSTKTARFHLPSVGLRRLGRAGALTQMAIDAAGTGSQRDWRLALDVLSAFACGAVSGSLREGGDYAYAKYVKLTQPEADDYVAWVRHYDTFTSVDAEFMQERISALAHQPLISILLPVYNPQEHWLRRCLESVVAQVYPNWELCVADDASTSRHVRRVLEEYAKRDPRVRVVFREENGHISEATNSALAMANGDYIALLDHDDELRPHSLFEMVAALNRRPEWRLLYSDEDKIDEKGNRFSPYFKPHWNYELFLSQNCISHLGMYDASLVREVGGFRKGFEGAQDWDLGLRCIEKLCADEIGHVSKVLYHWRAIEGSTALGVGHKDYASAAGRQAVAEHLARTGQPARVEINPYGHLNVYRALPVSPRVSLIIPTRDKVELLRTCVQSILEKTDYHNYELIVVDNQSEEAATFSYFRELESESRVRILRYNAPFNYSLINNYAAARATGAIIGLVNNDIEVITPEWMAIMVSQAIRPEIGAVGAMLYYPNDTIQHAGVVLGMGSVAGHAYTGLPAGTDGQCGRALLAQEVSAVTAACLFVRKEIFDEVGGLDEALTVAFNDVDFCVRILKAGYRNLWTPYAKLYHHESASRGYEDTPEKQARFDGEVAFMCERWGDYLLSDPCYNANLTLAGAPFELAFPPRDPVDDTRIDRNPDGWKREIPAG